MTNEEKILELLGTMNKRMERMEGDVSGLKQDVSGLKQEQMWMRATLQENSLMINAMKTNLEMMDAKLDNIRITTVSTKQFQGLKQQLGKAFSDISNELLGEGAL